MCCSLRCTRYFGFLQSTLGTYYGPKWGDICDPRKQFRDKCVFMGFVQGRSGNICDLREQVQVGLARRGVEF